MNQKSKKSSMNNFKIERKGVTPVIAVLLLLMMTVAAAGGAWIWMNQLMEEFQEEGEGELDEMDIGISIEDLSCDEKEIDMLLRNSGETAISSAPVDVIIRESATGERYTSLYDADFTEGSTGSYFRENPEGDISNPADVYEYELQIDDEWTEDVTLESATNYEITVRFIDENDYEVRGSCRG